MEMSSLLVHEVRSPKQSTWAEVRVLTELRFFWTFEGEPVFSALLACRCREHPLAWGPVVSSLKLAALHTSHGAALSPPVFLFSRRNPVLTSHLSHTLGFVFRTVHQQP